MNLTGYLMGGLFGLLIAAFAVIHILRYDLFTKAANRGRPTSTEENR